jgi:hypothetical protein
MASVYLAVTESRETKALKIAKHNRQLEALSSLKL